MSRGRQRRAPTGCRAVPPSPRSPRPRSSGAPGYALADLEPAAVRPRQQQQRRRQRRGAPAWPRQRRTSCHAVRPPRAGSEGHRPGLTCVASGTASWGSHVLPRARSGWSCSHPPFRPLRPAPGAGAQSLVSIFSQSPFVTTEGTALFHGCARGRRPGIGPTAGSTAGSTAWSTAARGGSVVCDDERSTSPFRVLVVAVEPREGHKMPPTITCPGPRHPARRRSHPGR